MRRFVYPMAFWLYVSLDHVLQGIGAALYHWQGWEMAFIWLVSVGFIGMIAALVFRDRQQRILLFAPTALPGGKEMTGTLLLLLLFTACLSLEVNSVYQWWHSDSVALWFKLLYATTQGIFWAVAGRWWKDTVKTLLQMWESHTLKGHLG